MNVNTKLKEILPEGRERLRVCAYLRVSTGKQADSDLSIPDQRRQINDFCSPRAWPVVSEFIEPGATATDDSRPQFQAMIERATDPDRPFDAILVHSYSRFFRDNFAQEMYIRRLTKAGVRLISITQELGDDPAQVMMRQIIGLFDEYQSRENGKHVVRAMKENARQGFYNGSPVPLGYRAEEAEKRGIKVKKKLAVDPVEAETVKFIFQLYARGDGTSGPLGIKVLTARLNAEGYRTKKGARFGVGSIHAILTNTVYVGEAFFNKRDSKTGKKKPTSEHISVPVPPIIKQAEFDAVQAQLRSRDPRVESPRITTGPILLTGIAVCADCEGGMTLRTGTSRNGKVHRYYTCSACARSGKTVCKGRSIRMDTLDELVVEHLSDRLFTAERLTEILASIVASRAEKSAEVDGRITKLQHKATEAEEKLKRLYSAIEDGVAEIDDILKNRISVLKAEREHMRVALDRINGQNNPSPTISPEILKEFARVMRENIQSGEIPMRKAYLRSVIDRIEVADDAIRVIGSPATLEHAVAGKGGIGNLAGVRSSVRKWRSQLDSNQRPPD